MLDERLSLAERLYPASSLAADIGTDHAHLPIALLTSGRCSRMILTDISEGALANARREITKAGLHDRSQLRLGDGLAPLHEKCNTVSILGMGGKTICQILRSGTDRLQGAALILSAHTDIPVLRRTLCELSYTIDAEEPVLDAGRFYLVFRAIPGIQVLTPMQIRLGTKLFESDSPWLGPYLNRRVEILQHKRDGLLSARVPDEAGLSGLTAEIHFLTDFIHSRHL